MESHTLILDANIIVRAVLGNKVRQSLMSYNEIVGFFTPDSCIEEVEKHLPLILKKRNLSPELAMEVLSKIKCLLQIVDKSIYQQYQSDALKRIHDRDPKDWPVVATALMFKAAIWTEDKDFFGLGIPVWTSDRIHLFFSSLACTEKYENIN